MRRRLMRRRTRALAGIASLGVPAVAALVAACSGLPLPSIAGSDGADGQARSLRWQRIDTSLPGCRVTTAIQRRSGALLAPCQGPDLAPRILTSEDGEQWTISTPSGLEPRRAIDVVVLNGLTETPAGTLVLVGAEALGDLSSGDAVSWTSTDGISWQRAAAGPALVDAEMEAVISTPAGIWAVGADGFPGASTQLPTLRGGAIWRSSDGSTWQRLPSPQSFDRYLISGILATSSGLVAWGDEAAPGSGGVWAAPDLRTWSMAEPPSGGAWGPLARIVSIGADLLAVGTWTTTATSGDVLTVSGAWTSGDGGRRWINRPVAIDPALEPIWDVGSIGASLFAMVPNGNVLRSDDGGVTWAWMPRDPVLGLATLTPLLSTSEGLIAFGSIPGDMNAVNAIWRATLVP